jgi:hypothetical protein
VIHGRGSREREYSLRITLPFIFFSATLDAALGLAEVRNTPERLPGKGGEMAGKRVCILTACLGALFYLACAAPADAQWQIETKDGKATLRIGFLAQPQLETLEGPNNGDTAVNLFIRRFRMVFGGKVSDKWTYFFETDSPNVGKANPDRTANPTGSKDAGAVFIQDMFITYNQSNAFKVDVGLMLLPHSHNHLQSAASLLPVDYGPYTFLESGLLQERVARDYGVQLRGYPGHHLEYRFDVLQGVRGPGATNALRFSGRLVYYPFAAETGFFYAGTYQGSRRLVALAASADTQKDYRNYGGDAFVELPIHKGEQGVTGQAQWIRYDGGDFLPSLPKQDTYLFEGGYHLKHGRYTPFFQYALRDFADAAMADQSVLQAGLAYWMAGHQRNLKFSAGRLHTDGRSDQTQILAQLQVFFY